MKGLYLYCIREKTNSRFSSEGIDGSKVFTILYRDLEAIVSRVSLREFGSKEIQKNAQEDLGWIKEKALLHEKVIEQAMKRRKRIVNVIPMKFGVIFKTKEKLVQTLKKHYAQFRKNLENLSRKQEWAVKVYLNRKTFEKEIKKVSPVVQKKEKEMSQLPEGVAYFMQRQIDEVVSKEADKVLRDYIKGFFEHLGKYTEVGTKSKILQKELTGKSLPMTLNAIFLVAENNLENFIKEIDKLKKENKSKGFEFEYSGPWPPYNFV